MEEYQFSLNVDRVFCISLEGREDRRKMLRDEFKRMTNEIEFILVDKDTENPERGCFESHIKCAQIALSRGYERTLILEDDATLISVTKKQASRINRFLKIRNPQLFHLGGIIGREWLIPYPGVVRSRLTGAHAYVLNKKACKRLSTKHYDGTAIDSLFCRFFRSYCAYPMISLQQPEATASSDIMEFRSRGKAKRVKDEIFWENNYKKQNAALRRNWLRTLFLRFL